MAGQDAWGTPAGPPPVGVAVNTTYYYRVSAQNAGTNSGWSNVASVLVAPPATPTRLSASASQQRVNPPYVSLSWQESGSSAIGVFTLQRATNPQFSLGPRSASFSLAGLSRSYVDGNLGRNTTYYYRLQASNGAGSSTWVTVAVTTPR